MTLECPRQYRGSSNQDCVAEDTGYRVTKRQHDKQVTVTVEHAGAATQTFEVPVDGYSGSGALLLRRLLGGSTPDVLVSTTSSGAHGQNSTWAVWSLSGDSVVPRGTLYGTEFWDAGSGLVASYASGGGWSVEFSRLRDGAFQSVVAVGRADTAGVRDPTVPDCTVSPSSAAPASVTDPCGLAMRQAQRHGLTT